VVALRSVRALRWLPAAPATEVVVRRGALDGDRVDVAIDGHARAVAILADRYPTPPPAALGPLRDARPSERTAAAMYADRMMFHGPAYQGVTEISAMGSDGIDGVLSSLAAPGGLLDSTGQLMGYWMMMAADRDRLALPVSIDELAFHGPPPAVGSAVRAAVRVTDLDAGRIRADHELTVGGTVWCRITGWQDRRFQSDDVMWPLFLHPEERLVTEPHPGGWELVRERWTDSASRELVLRRYTDARERAQYDALTPRAQRTWLLGRVAVKDAVRRWLRDQDPAPRFPVEVGVHNLDDGRPVVTVPDGVPTPRVSLAHVDGVAVALVAPDGAPGIDIVAVDGAGDRVADHVERLALTPAERERLPDPGPDRALAVARLWAAKEAAAKSAGTGLEGRPRQFAVDEVDGPRLRIGGAWIDTEVVDVGGSPHVVAWTTGATA
jgi:phosphopantetheinyl transferase (holo-ACP synthase)